MVQREQDNQTMKKKPISKNETSSGTKKSFEQYKEPKRQSIHEEEFLLADHKSLFLTGKPRLYKAVLSILLVALIALSMFFLGRVSTSKESRFFFPLKHLLSKTSKKPDAPFPPAEEPSIVLLPHFTNMPDSRLQQYGTSMDACGILSSCFNSPDSGYRTARGCKSNLGLTLRYYDSAFLVERIEGHADKLIGFISIDHQTRKIPNNEGPHKEMHAFFIYNVCIHPEKRGTGLGKRMVPEFIDTMIDHHKLQPWANSRGLPGEPTPLLLGLDVELPTPMAAESFSMYAKLGYFRWWHPCGSIGFVDWPNLVNPPASSPNLVAHSQTTRAKYLEMLLFDPKSLEKIIRDAKRVHGPNGKEHFCMFKYYSDSLSDWGKRLRDMTDPYHIPSEPAL